MYRIGEFSHLCETTIKTLRHYDKINLLKPTKVDNFTGYRYYEEDQIKTLEKIKQLQYAGFSLKDIKDLLKETNKEKLNKQIEIIKEENSKKIMILQKMKNNMTKQTVELITNPNFLIVGKITTIKDRNSIAKVIEQVDKKQNNDLKKYDMIIENYEKGYKEKNINCFIGRIIPEKMKNYPDVLLEYKKKGLIFLNSNKVDNVLHAEVKESITETYKEMIEYASKNNIQIRGKFQEVYSKDKIDIYVEAYDLNIENEDELFYRNNLKNKIKDIHDKEFIGTWVLQGEVTELQGNFNPLKKHYYPDTKYKILELNKDGTTNFENITWKEDYLIIKENNITYYSYLIKPKRKLFKKYMRVLIKQKESNARPYCYYYKKIK